MFASSEKSHWKHGIFNKFWLKVHCFWTRFTIALRLWVHSIFIEIICDWNDWNGFRTEHTTYFGFDHLSECHANFECTLLVNHQQCWNDIETHISIPKWNIITPHICPARAWNILSSIARMCQTLWIFSSSMTFHYQNRAVLSHV